LPVPNEGSPPDSSVDAGFTTQGVRAIDSVAVGKTYTTKSRRLEALVDVSFHARQREFIAIVGPSGCGKTTLLKMVAGLVAPTSGTVKVHGEVVRGPISGVGMVFQAPVLLRWRSVLDNVLFPIEILRRKRSDYEEPARGILQLVGLEGFEDRRPSELSGGMQQRVAIARALIHDPPLLLMDEPFGALDQLTREQMNLELIRIWSETHKTTMLITHSIEEAVFLADRVIVMSARPGRVIDSIDIDLPRPRGRSVKRESRFGELVDRIGALLGLLPGDEARPSTNTRSH
jgi:NitT/TauT family transport system ATP-binding protein